jgi:hypothetical protein
VGSVFSYEYQPYLHPEVSSVRFILTSTRCKLCPLYLGHLWLFSMPPLVIFNATFGYLTCIFFLTTKAMLLAAVRPSDQPYFRLAFRSFPCLCSFHFLKKPKTVQKSTIENHQTSNTPLDLPRGFSSCTHRGATPFELPRWRECKHKSQLFQDLLCFSPIVIRNSTSRRRVIL